MNKVPVINVHLPEYSVDTEPDYVALGKIVDAEIKKHFLGQTVVVRGIGSSKHSGKSMNELIEIIQRDGTDRYNPARKGDRYENIQGKHIDLFGFRRKITPRTQVYEEKDESGQYVIHGTHLADDWDGDWSKFHLYRNGRHWWGDGNDFAELNEAYRKIRQFTEDRWGRQE